MALRASVNRSAVVVRASAEPRQALGALAFGATFALSAMLTAAPAKADITADLLAKSAENKALNNKKRLATSSANVARSRTVADGTCSFPTNFFGCDETSARFTGGVRFIQDDVDLECAGTANGRCASKVNHNYGAKGF
ncbi:Photosystem I reaction center subunit N [Monoraphidium neglectum]|uniref:Photosystem I reaction center subunit N n=1 Tax=Monoraphidium neglectum TaxID=145388 RepID=A0A0D2LM54_9CHLO|nr:Photosystem I reaction center subunit N [Monoraphidium neglectum]KIZ07429.1 Photosystem I reaction center subunit N [Monoraphidium neglectum]|eukprot:XP_013906448.1 Photosystem I reaction center subunit N [Monoraphidium neglectum]